MYHHMSLQSLGLSESSVTLATLVSPLGAVDEHVSLKVCLLIEGSPTFLTAKRAETTVSEHVGLQVVVLENKQLISKCFNISHRWGT